MQGGGSAICEVQCLDVVGGADILLEEAGRTDSVLDQRGVANLGLAVEASVGIIDGDGGTDVFDQQVVDCGIVEAATPPTVASTTRSEIITDSAAEHKSSLRHKA